MKEKQELLYENDMADGRRSSTVVNSKWESSSESAHLGDAHFHGLVTSLPGLKSESMGEGNLWKFNIVQEVKLFDYLDHIYLNKF